MSRRPRRNHTPAFKAKVALAAIKGDRTLAQLADSSTSTPIKSRPGRTSFSKEPPMCLAPVVVVTVARAAHQRSM